MNRLVAMIIETLDGTTIELVKIASFSMVSDSFKLRLINRIVRKEIRSVKMVTFEINKINTYLKFIGGEDKMDERRELECNLWYLYCDLDRKSRSKLIMEIHNKHRFELIDKNLLSLDEGDYIYHCISKHLQSSELKRLIYKYGTGLFVPKISISGAISGWGEWTLTLC